MKEFWKKIINKDILIYIILIIFAMLISLHSSIYPVNENGYISTDVSIWINIAKKMSHGEIMYLDFFDHKGPILYFIYYIGYILGKNLGIWMIDVICNAINVLMIYKISKSILKNKNKALIITAICMCYLSHLCIENPCTESIALPFILISFYQFTKFTINIRDFKQKESLCTGISLAIVLLLRPNLIALWIIYYLYFFIKLIKAKEIKHLQQIVTFSIIGVIIVFLPVIFYLIINRAFTDFINTYLIFNLEYASNKEKSMITVIQYFMYHTNYIIAFMCVAYILLICEKRNLDNTEYEYLKLSCIYFIFSFYLAIMPQRRYMHYLIPILPSLIIPLAIILKRINLNRKTNIILIVTFILYTSFSLFNTKTRIEEYSSYTSFYKEISKEVKQITKQEDNVLVLGNKAIIYLMSDREYKGKYLYQLPMANENKEMSNKIIKEIKNDLPDIIVNFIDIKEDDEKNLTNFKDEIKIILNENYYNKDDIIYVKK